MIQQLSERLVSMGQVLLALDTGVGLLIAVGFSMSASHLFSLLANRLTPRQIFLHMVMDALVLSLALLLCLISHCLMLALLEGVPLQPITFGNRMAVALWPGLFLCAGRSSLCQ
jgi:accessory gene regulator protein AgrB